MYSNPIRFSRRLSFFFFHMLYVRRSWPCYSNLSFVLLAWCLLFASIESIVFRANGLNEIDWFFFSTSLSFFFIYSVSTEWMNKSNNIIKLRKYTTSSEWFNTHDIWLSNRKLFVCVDVDGWCVRQWLFLLTLQQSDIKLTLLTLPKKLISFCNPGFDSGLNFDLSPDISLPRTNWSISIWKSNKFYRIAFPVKMKCEYGATGKSGRNHVNYEHNLNKVQKATKMAGKLEKTEDRKEKCSSGKTIARMEKCVTNFINNLTNRKTKKRPRV